MEEEDVLEGDSLPVELISFWEKHNVASSLRNLNDQHRFFRVTAKGRAHHNMVSELQALNAEPAALTQFFRVSSSVSLASLPMYVEGRVAGLDLSSGAAVSGLDVHHDHHVLDLCCAPGMVCLYCVVLYGS
jgi:16S rRNA C967 or C1407 C5-methylase (RsmB/RsmF family)